MKYLLDTCVISETVRRSPLPAVLAWLDGQREENLYLSVLTIGEIRKGIFRLDDSRRKEALAGWVDGELVRRFAARLLPVDIHVASIWGEIAARAERSGRRIPVIDGLIGATALCHDCTVATRNTSDIQASGARVINPFI